MLHTWSWGCIHKSPQIYGIAPQSHIWFWVLFRSSHPPRPSDLAHTAFGHWLRQKQAGYVCFRESRQHSSKVYDCPGIGCGLLFFYSQSAHLPLEQCCQLQKKQVTSLQGMVTENEDSHFFWNSHLCSQFQAGEVTSFPAHHPIVMLGVNLATSEKTSDLTWKLQKLSQWHHHNYFCGSQLGGVCVWLQMLWLGDGQASTMPLLRFSQSVHL